MNNTKNKMNSPKLARWLFYRMTEYQKHHSIAGDVEEVFFRKYSNYGYFKAWRWYWKQCLYSMIRYISYIYYRSKGMFKNYLRSAYRFLIRQKLYFIINTTGLALGLACCMLIYLYVSDEMSFDRFHENETDLYRILKVFYDDADGSVSGHQSSVQPGLGPLLTEYFPEMKYQSRYMSTVNVVGFENVKFRERITVVDEHFFDMFTYKFIAGDPSIVISEDNNIVLSRSYAEKFFGDKDPVGKSVTVISAQEMKNYIVTGIFENVSSNSTLQFNMVVNISNMSFLTRVKDADKILNSHWFDTYVQLEPGSSAADIDKRFHAFTSQYFEQFIQQSRDKGDWTREGNPYTFILQPMKNVHFDIAFGGNRRLQAAYILITIALTVLIIACINFVNLSIGMAGGRSKDIGIRKVAGAKKKQLLLQFWSESVIISFCAMIMGILMSTAILPVFNELSGKNLNIVELFSMKNILLIIGFSVTAGILSGIYPALIMSGFRPVDILKGKFRLSGKNNITKILVVTQFSLSIILIVMSISLGKQVDFLINKDLGYERDGLIGIFVQEQQNYNSSKRTVELFRERVIQNPNIRNMTATSSYFGLSGAPNYGIQGKQFHWSTIEENYIKTLEIRILQGKDFGKDGVNVPDAAIVNESFVTAYGIEDPVGKVLGREFSRKGMYKENITLDNMQIIAVVEDFHYGPLQGRLLPSIFCLRPMRDFRIMLVRIGPENIQDTIAFLEKKWTEIQPDKPFNYYFHEERLENLYNSEKRWSAIINYVSVITIIIACMGLFGLSLISVNRRVKEIGIRKALGAKVQQISGWILREFIFLVLLSNVVAWPAAYLFLQQYLETYVFRIDIGASLFIYAGMSSLIISVLTIAYTTVRSALRNPVDSLRYE